METIVATYKQLLHPKMDFGCGIWFPNVSAMSVKKLQIHQNQALRIATGCHKKASNAHLYAETGVLTINRHLKLLCSHLLASTLCPSHVSHGVVTSPPGPGAMKQTLYSKSIKLVERYLTNRITPEVSYKRIPKSLHTDAVSAEYCEAAPNKLLRFHPPKIHLSEETLPRPHRRALSQLSSDYCARLKSYQFSIGKAEDDICAECG
jgi:hypothetical protein